MSDADVTATEEEAPKREPLRIMPDTNREPIGPFFPSGTNTVEVGVAQGLFKEAAEARQSDDVVAEGDEPA